MPSKYYPDGRVVPGTTWEPQPKPLTQDNEAPKVQTLEKPKWKPPVFLGWGPDDGDDE